jgi:hypothetical protein
VPYTVLVPIKFRTPGMVDSSRDTSGRLRR